MGAYFTRNLEIAGTANPNPTVTNFFWEGDEQNYRVDSIEVTDPNSSFIINKTDKTLRLNISPQFKNTHDVKVYCLGKSRITLGQITEHSYNDQGMLVIGNIDAIVHPDQEEFLWSAGPNGNYALTLRYSVLTWGSDSTTYEATGAKVLLNGQQVGITYSGQQWSECTFVVPRALKSPPLIHVEPFGRIVLDEGAVPPPPPPGTIVDGSWDVYFTTPYQLKLNENGFANGNGYWDPVAEGGVIGCDKKKTCLNGVVLYKQRGSNDWFPESSAGPIVEN